MPKLLDDCINQLRRWIDAACLRWPWHASCSMEHLKYNAVVGSELLASLLWMAWCAEIKRQWVVKVDCITTHKPNKSPIRNVNFYLLPTTPQASSHQPFTQQHKATQEQTSLQMLSVAPSFCCWFGLLPFFPQCRFCSIWLLAKSFKDNFRKVDNRFCTKVSVGWVKGSHVQFCKSLFCVMCVFLFLLQCYCFDGR